MNSRRMTTGPSSARQTPFTGRARALVLVAVVAVLAVVAAVVTVVVSSATYSPTPRTMSPRIQVAAGSDHVDAEAGLVVRVPEGWSAVSDNLVFGTTALVPEEQSSAGEQGPAGGEPGPGGIVLVGALSQELFAAQEPDNQRAAAVLVSGMGEFFLPIPGQRTDQRMEEISSRAGDGWALSYRVVPDSPEGTGLPPEGGLVYTAVVGEGEKRFWLTYVASPADGSMTSPRAEWADEIVERLRPTGTAA